MDLLDADASGGIDKEEFKSRATRWLKVIKQYVKHSQAEKAVKDEKDKYQKAKAKARKNGRFKSIALLLLGISMLTVLVEPLTQSVRIFSENLKIAPFYVSFILVPLATNARAAIAAIIAAKQKRHHTTSLTFSQIYHKVFMNNILGFSVLVSVIYFRGLTWHFSADRGSSFGHCLSLDRALCKFQYQISNLDIVPCLPSISIIIGPCVLCGRYIHVYMKFEVARYGIA